MGFLRHRVQTEIPNLSLIKEEGTRNALDQFFRVVQKTLTNIYDDLVGLTPGRSAALPTASVEQLGRFYIRINAGAADTLHFCRYNGSTLIYEWKTVTLS